MTKCLFFTALFSFFLNCKVQINFCLCSFLDKESASHISMCCVQLNLILFLFLCCLCNIQLNIHYLIIFFRSGAPQPAQQSKRLQQTQAQVDEVNLEKHWTNQAFSPHFYSFSRFRLSISCVWMSTKSSNEIRSCQSWMIVQVRKYLDCLFCLYLFILI